MITIVNKNSILIYNLDTHIQLFSFRKYGLGIISYPLISRGNIGHYSIKGDKNVMLFSNEIKYSIHLKIF